MGAIDTSSDWLAARPPQLPRTPGLRIGGVVLASPVVQAALSGYSDSPMRRLARRFGAAYTLGEVMLDQFLVTVRMRKRTRHFLEIADEEHPVGGQLMGAEPLQFAAGARRLAAAGFDVIDINFGCPVKKVVGRCRGGFHLSQPEVALEILRRTRDALPERIPLTVKLRRGIDDSAASRERVFAILDGAWAAGVAAVTVHGRTVKQRYEGRSCWEFLAEVKRQAGERTVLGSGDLFSPGDCLQMLEQTGVDGVSVARGAIGNPWIFEHTQALLAGLPLPDPPRVFEQREVIREHYALARECYGAERCGPLMRKFGIKYAALHPRYAEVRQAFTRVRSPEDWERLFARWYAEDLPGHAPPEEVHRSQGSGQSSVASSCPST